MLAVGVDVGSTSVKAGVITPGGPPPIVEPIEYQSFSPRPGWIEQDPDELWQAVCTVISSVVRQVGRRRTEIRALSLSVQRGTVIPVDRTGHAIYRAVSWQDLRAQGEWFGLQALLGDEFERITGLYPSAYWTLPKLAWLSRQEPELWRAAHRFVFVHGYLVRRLGCEDAIEDPTNASFSGLLDVVKRDWSDRILSALDLDRERLGTLRPPGAIIGEISRAAAACTNLPPGTALVCGAGDQQAVALGAGTVTQGSVVANIGTAGVVLACSPARPVHRSGSVAFLAHVCPGLFQAEAMLGSAGSVLRWLASLTKSATGFRYGGSIDRGLYRQIDAEAASVPAGCGGLVVIPLFSEEHAAGRRPGAILGLSLSHDRPAIARAIMEGTAFEVRRLLGELSGQGISVKSIILCGGAAQSQIWNQIHADVIGQPITTLSCNHAGVLGAGVLAALGVGLYGDIKTAVRDVARSGMTYDPGSAMGHYEELYRDYERVRANVVAGSSHQPARQDRADRTLRIVTPGS